MKTVKFYNTEQSVDIEDIADIESNFRLQFPRVYVTHLLLHNGGQCDPNVFSFIENGKETKSCVDWFLALYDGEYDNLEKYFELRSTNILIYYATWRLSMLIKYGRWTLVTSQ